MDRKSFHSSRNFFSGPFNPKYKDINLFDSEPIVNPMKKMHEIIFERGIEREKQLKLIKKCKKNLMKKQLKGINFL